MDIDASCDCIHIKLEQEEIRFFEKIVFLTLTFSNGNVRYKLQTGSCLVTIYKGRTHRFAPTNYNMSRPFEDFLMWAGFIVMGHI
ncbi:MAG: hypothetical protein DRQ41_15625 [Gammaproteobacteria bacterium]|nr:MAG: hypothetical protein DRQ41_15625 [Gammaproteobacteria bacterium]